VLLVTSTTVTTPRPRHVAVALALSLLRITAGRLDELQSWTNFEDVAKRFNSYADPALSFELHLLTFERGQHRGCRSVRV
jgi:hypothetical protein